ncbi:MAG: TRAP transporter substrate-binding protein DctP [Rhodomicrobium sp.]
MRHVIGSTVLRRSSLQFVGAVLMLSGGTPVRSIEAAEEPLTKIRLALPPEAASPTRASLKQFKVEVERRRNNRVQLELLTMSEAGRLGTPPEMSASLLSSHTDVIPALGLFSLPFSFRQPEIAAAAMAPRGLMRRGIDGMILAATGLHVLFWIPLSPEVFVSKNASLVGPGSLAGKRVGTLSRSVADFIALCGGEPVYSKTSNSATFQEQGLDGVSASPEIIVTNSLWTAFHEVTLTRHAVDAWVISITEKRWHELPEDLRLDLDNAAALAEERERGEVGRAEAQALGEMAKHKMNIVELRAGELDEWKSCASAMFESYDKAAGDMGASMLKAYRRLFTTMSGSPSIGQ